MDFLPQHRLKGKTCELGILLYVLKQRIPPRVRVGTKIHVCKILQLGGKVDILGVCVNSQGPLLHRSLPGLVNGSPRESPFNLF